MDALEALARARGVEPELMDGLGHRRRTSQESLMAILRALGEPIDRPEDALDALRRPVDRPRVLVAWDGRLDLPLAGERDLEGVSDLGERWTRRAVPERGVAQVEVPPGVHDVHWEGGQAWVIAAPSRAYGQPERVWGLFAPLYALYEEGRRDLATYGTLRRSAELTERLGGRYFATLPLLPTFAEAPRREPSPYAPVSRLFWNELYLDLGAVPEADPSSPSPLPEVDRFIDWDAEADARLPALRELAGRCQGEARAALEAWADAHPLVHAYASHRAAASFDGDPAMVDAFRYAQWRAAQQIEGVRGLYLDLPLGVHHDGFDVARWPGRFVRGCAAGAPPDPLFVGGQNWGLPPMHPERDRAQGYAYVRACLEHHMRVAEVLRIDHVAWLHRLYWIPQHAEATDGAYVNNPCPEELYAILSLLSHRHRCRVVGEDLGTVPQAVRDAMEAHGLWRTWVLQLFAHEGGWDAPPDPCVVTVNTHDLPTFAGWWEMRDIDDWVALGLFDEGQARAEKERRGRILQALRRAAGAGDDASPVAVVGELMRLLSTGPGQLLLVTVEDLFGEVRSQNVPGTHRERPNWRRRAAQPLEAIASHAEVLRRIGEARR